VASGNRKRAHGQEVERGRKKEEKERKRGRRQIQKSSRNEEMRK
jgi:hypothetical protein